MSQEKKKLDTVVKLALGVFFGSFILIGIGMFLTRPDRSIPPYSIGSQEGTAVAVHVPSWTSDPEIETLIYRFRKVGRGTRNFGSMKIQPTTPDHPEGRYRHIEVYIFTNNSWTEPEMLHRYLATDSSESADDVAFREGFQNAVRGFYGLKEVREEGRIGPLLRGEETPATKAYVRVLFRGPLTTNGHVPPGGPTRSPSPPPASGEDRGL